MFGKNNLGKSLLMTTILGGISALSISVLAYWRFGEAYDTASIIDYTGRGNDLIPYLRINDCTAKFRMGRNCSPIFGATYPQEAHAALKGWGRWDRILSSAEKTALNGKEYWPFSTTTTLQDAKAYFLLDEAGGSPTYADATGRGNDLTATGTTVQVAGPLGTDYATKLAHGIWLEKTVPGNDLKSHQANYTIAGWVNLTDKANPAGPSQQVFWGQLNNDIGQSGFNVYFDPDADRFVFDLDGGDGVDLDRGSLVLDTTFGSPSLATWYFVICEYDYTNNLSSISTNNGTKVTLTNILQPLPEAGKIGNASRFYANPVGAFSPPTKGWDAAAGYPVTGNSNVWLTPNSDISIGNNAKTVFGWFKAASTTANQTLAGIYAGTNATLDWRVYILSNNIYFTTGGSSSASVNIALSDTNWHLIVCWFDKTANRIYIDLDNGSLTANATGAPSPHTVSNDFRFGSDKTSSGLHQFTGLIEGWGIANGTPTAADIASIWNNGNGRYIA